MKKTMIILTLFCFFMTLSGCNETEIITSESLTSTESIDTSENLSETTEEIDILSEKIDSFYDAGIAQIHANYGEGKWEVLTSFQEDVEGITFFHNIDILYYAIVLAWNTPEFEALYGTSFSNISVTLVDNIYTLNFDYYDIPTTIIITGDLDSNLKIEGYENSVLTYYTERVVLDNGYLAYQLSVKNVHSYIGAKFYSDGIYGRLSITESPKMIYPESIYGLSEIESSYAYSGDRIYLLTEGNFEFTEN